MLSNSKLGGFLLLVTLAAAGYAVVTFLPWVIEQYEKASAFNQYWGYFYLGVVILVAGIFAMLFGWCAWTLIANTRQKRRRIESYSRNPSQLSRAQQEREIAEHFGAGKELVEDPSLPPEVRAPIRESIDQLEAKMQREKLEIVAFGTISSG